MIKLDFSKNWTFYAVPPSTEAALELSVYFGLLRKQAGLKEERPPIIEGEADSTPCIFLKAAEGNPDCSGFTWKFEKARITISGDSVRGLWNGVFDFLAALGVSWPRPGQEELPPPRTDGSRAIYSLKNGTVSSPAPASARERKRLFLEKKTSAQDRKKLIEWAARNKYDALVFSLGEKLAGKKNAEYIKQAEHYGLIIEAGGNDLSLLMPRRLFLFHRGLFRMEQGKRKPDHHFCPTNHETISRIKEQARYLFARAMPEVTVPRVFHLLPDEGQENTWCACPACRAFNHAEQNLIAVNSAADALASLDTDALLSFFDYGMEPETLREKRGIIPRKNLFFTSATAPEGRRRIF
jgi:hypothetical protein